MTRRLRALWNVGQYTNVSREFQLLEESNKVPGTFEPVDLSGADVTVTLIHDSWGHTAVDELEGEVIDAEEGRAEFTFTAEHLAAHGDHRIQFVVDYGDEEQLVPPHAGDWIVAVGRRAAGADLPLDISELTAAKATIEDLYADHLEVGQATISEVIGDPEISSLSIDELDVDSLAGGIVSDGLLNGSLHGPGLTIDDGDLAVTLDIEEIEGLANPFNEHVDANNYDINNLRYLFAQAVTIGGDGPIEGILEHALDDDNRLQGFDHLFREDVDADGNDLENAGTVNSDRTETDELTGGFISSEQPDEGLWVNPNEPIVENGLVEVGTGSLANTVQAALDYADAENLEGAYIPTMQFDGAIAPYPGQTIKGGGEGQSVLWNDGTLINSDNNPERITYEDITIEVDDPDNSAFACLVPFDNDRIRNVELIPSGAEHALRMSSHHGSGVRIDGLNVPEHPQDGRQTEAVVFRTAGNTIVNSTINGRVWFDADDNFADMVRADRYRVESNDCILSASRSEGIVELNGDQNMVTGCNVDDIDDSGTDNHWEGQNILRSGGS